MEKFQIKLPLLARLLRFIFHRFQHVRGVPRMLFFFRKVYFNNKISLVNTPDNIPMYLDRDDYSQLMNFFFDYCIGQRKLILDNIKQGDVVLDLGANTGIITFDVSKKVGINGFVLGVDCNKQLIAQMTEIIERFDISNCKVVETAVAGKNGYLYFNMPVSQSESGAVSNDGDGEKVKASTIVSLFETYCGGRIIDFIKVDIEGMETHIVESLGYLLEEQHPTLLVEFHPNKCIANGFDPNEIRHKLITYGYMEFRIKEFKNGYETFTSDMLIMDRENILYVYPRKDDKI